MKKGNPSDGILVFDRYYGRKPIVGLLAAERILFCALLSAMAMLYIFTEYRLSVSAAFVGFISAICAALFSVLFIFVKRRYAVPAVFVGAGLLIYHNFEEFWKRFSYFADEAMLLVEGRFLFPRQYLLHDERYLTPENRLYSEGLLLGSFILCALYALLCAASMKKRVRCMPALFGFVLLCIPRVLSETLEINVWLVPALLLFAAAMAIGIVYRNGLAVIRTGSGAYRRQVREDEHRFNSNIRGAGFFRRVGMKLSFYSKYFTTGAYCIAAAGISLWIGASVFGEGSSIDYSSLYELVTNIGEDVGISSSPFESGPVSDYFSSSDPERNNKGLNISSPGSGDRDIIKVTFFGDKPVYLRGDIGMDFTGNGWTTPLTTDSREWERSGLAESYRPCEADVVRTLLNALDSGYTDIISSTDVDIEYLCETDVVFLPAYTADYSYYDNPSFEVFGDFVVRVNSSTVGYVNSVQCTALAADFGTYSFFTNAEIVQQIETLFRENNVSVNGFYGTVVPEIASQENIITRYGEYAEQAYIYIPDYMSAALSEFMRSDEELSGVYNMLGDTNVSSAYRRYWIADHISRYLSGNYEYTLSGENSGDDPVMEFLTESKRGHCSLYASAMTLMLRELGIPARYCTGFAVYPFNSGLNTVVLQEKNLHAWVEVYLGELGWITFDPTSAAMSAAAGGNQSEYIHPEREETIDFPERPTLEADIPDRPDNMPAHQPPAAEEKQEIPTDMLVTALLILLAAVLIVLIIVHWISVKRRAEARIRRSDFRDGRDIGGRIIDILYCCKLQPEAGQLPSEYYAAADSRLGTNTAEHYALMEKSAFGVCEISADETRLLAQTLRSVYFSAIRRRGPIRRYRIRRLIISDKNAK